MLSFCGSLKPLNEVVKLWDFLFAYGVHMNIVAVVSQILLLRKEILSYERPPSIEFPPMNADAVVSIV